MRDYVEHTYREHPHTDYPMRLAEYLGSRFHVPQGGRVLDYGCGRGDFVAGFIRAGFDAYGFEPDSEYCAKVWPALANRFLKHAVANLDMVFSKSVIEHCPRPMVQVQHMLEILKPGGLCVAMTPDYKKCIDTFFDDFTHVHPFTEPSLRQIFEVAGFDEVTCETLEIIWTEPHYTILMATGRKT
jgi:SAM-dependent methyltransferase